MKHLIIDTNVPVKAANLHPKDDLDLLCSQKCLSFIKTLLEEKDPDVFVVLDSNREIINEYQKQIQTHREDNVASEFLVWIYKGMMSERVLQYPITKKGDDSYIEFPNSPALVQFDRSDRKFVALAKSDPEHPSIYNGSDTDWWNYRDALNKEGIHIEFLCIEYMRAKSKGEPSGGAPVL